MDTTNLLCKSIEWPKSSSERTFDKVFAGTLATAIEREGQFNPILVRPHPVKANHYIGVQGKHRWYAIHKCLRRDLIEAKVATEMDETEADLAMTAENLWRNELTKPQRVKAIKKWCEYYDAKLLAKQAEAQAKSAQKQDDGAAESAPAPVSDAKDEPTFAATVAAATGQSERNAKRAIRLAKAFDDEQLEVFDQMAVSQDDMTAVAQIADVAKRGEVVALIASGLDPKESIFQVTGSAAVGGSQSKAAAASKAAAKSEAKEELTDDEWFDQECGEKAAMLANPARYKADALLFRSLSALRHAFRSKAKKVVTATKDGGELGNFFFLVRRFINVTHPKDWLLCDICIGKGIDPRKAEPTKCGKCNGAGVLLATEEYL